jgi:Domain of unknown function (DUF4430)
MIRASAVAVLALVLAGCGTTGGHGTATLWVTRDRGRQVVFTGTVPAGITAMQALERVQKVTTHYGGRYVQSIDGVSGSLSGEKDWFFFVNGVESDEGATSVKLESGDVEWWDYRSWAHGQMSVPVVAGAFPQPFLRGFEWAKPGATVVATDASLARRLAKEVRGTVGAHASGNEILVSSTVPSSTLRIAQKGDAVVLTLGTAIAARLAADPAALRYRFGVKG